MTNLQSMKSKTEAELQYIMKDAHEAAVCARELRNEQAEMKYLDQINDAATELYRRRNLLVRK
jgi:transposase